jgi:phage I-like protein
MESRLAIAIAALAADLSSGPPTTFRILPAGSFRSWDGRPDDVAAWTLSETDGQRIVAELATRVRDSVIDYEHATLKAKAGAVKAPASGWFRTAEWRADGLWLTDVKWTAEAAQEIADKKYRYVSPVFSYDTKTGRVQSLLHAALTNDPGLDALTDLAALSAQFFINQRKENTMELSEKMIAALELAGDATEIEALAAIAALKTNVAALSARADAPDPAKFAPITAVAALQVDNAALAARLTALQSEADAGRVTALIERGKAGGNLPPALEGWARELGGRDIAALTAYLEKTPVIIRPGQTQTGGEGRTGAAALSAEMQTAVKIGGWDPKVFQTAAK